jgi:DNA-binding MarR family transcriptional regulator
LKQQKNILPPSINMKLCDAVSDVDSLLSRARQTELDTLSIRLNSPKMRIISTLARAGSEGLSLTELARHCLREPSTVSSLLSKLENDSIVTRISGRKRERCRFILTETGKDLFYNRIKNNSVSMFFESLTSEEQDTLLKFLERLIVSGKDMLGIDFVPKFLK